MSIGDVVRCFFLWHLTSKFAKDVKIGVELRVRVSAALSVGLLTAFARTAPRLAENTAVKFNITENTLNKSLYSVSQSNIAGCPFSLQLYLLNIAH